MKKVCVVGRVNRNVNLLNGMRVKTKILVQELIREYGEEQVMEIDTKGLNILLLVPRLIKALATCRNVIILPAHNGVKVMCPILVILNMFFYRKIHYDVIGGWLPSLLDNNRYLMHFLKRYDGIYVETETMRTALEERGFSNIVILPNCKDLPIIDESKLKFSFNKPYRLATFSRVMEQKGIGDAITVIENINGKCGEVVFTLDVYGQIDVNEKGWFDDLMSKASSAVSYRGMAPFDKSVEILQDYFALLFPTKFYTEGIPGTIIDAYAAGVPVISSKWESFADLIDDEETGIGFEFGNTNAFREVLERIAKNPCIIIEMKKNCIAKAYNYLPSSVIPKINLNDN